MTKANLKIVEQGSPIEEARGRLKVEQDHIDSELRQVAELETSREKILLEGDDQLLNQLENSIKSLQKTYSRRHERIALLEKQIATLEADQAAEDHRAEKQAKYDAAKQLIHHATRFQTTGYREHAAAIAAGLELIRAADRAAAQVNADLPDGQEPLTTVSHLNHVPVNGDDIGWRPRPLYERIGELPNVGRYERQFWPR